MNYIQYINGDDANGEGMRCTLFVSGCELACKGCHNPESWKTNAGVLYTKEFEDQIIEDLKNPYIQGLSLSGGHPLHPKNFNTVLSLCKRVKEEVGKGIWLWTGLTLRQLTEDYRKEILPYIDVLIDGKFEEGKKNTSLKWRGSDNQNVIYLK
ncbi:ribonucleotide reductase of class III (anaerobic), activating protein [Vibrio phage vB_VibM_10AMN]|uniref:Anaerobic ribonucleoside-triphosphate reductase-activating protein n=1 Tax=Staphylococcus phage vB_VibM_10AMN12 TaxID=3076785 RepID=A0AA96R3T6_9CAUD|nr:ribonucleotide reductase of class III (anaerobic), activating protein [Vibrio phage vB_VibM_10AMN]WNO47486.1 ribonucleotide reductase of class III (anaerobic), activating protein [Staphylococcus phage vB_VibM_10AMN12]